MLLETQLKDVMTSEDREVRSPIGWVLVYDEQLRRLSRKGIY